MARCHGCRTIENMRNLVGIQEDKLEEETIAFESRIADLAAEAKRTNGPGQIMALPGAQELISQVSSCRIHGNLENWAYKRCLHPSQISRGSECDPERRPGWAIVTSGKYTFKAQKAEIGADLTLCAFSATAAYAKKAFPASGVAQEDPVTFVTGDLVAKGKPDPEPYLLGAKLAKADPAACVVLEDAPPGVLAGKRSGARVIGLRTTHDGALQWAQGADFVVEDLRKVSARWEGTGKAARLILTIESEEKPVATQGSE